MVPYVDFKIQKLLKNLKDKKFYRTLLYSSINNYRGKRQSRKDDLESLIYIIKEKKIIY